MSSSVFIESSSIPNETDVTLGASTDSNLVVVYGKNGINFDHKGLENLIEEKTLSSISVIRLTSPTPSMEAEEEEAEKLQEIGSSEETDIEKERQSDSEADEQDKINGSEDEESGLEEYNLSADEYEESGIAEDKLHDVQKQKKKLKKKSVSTKKQRTKKLTRKERPEIVGLTVEEFYTAEDANAVLKEALRKAGISTIKHTAEYEFQLYVIKNDHCYTPFTSPEQMKTKLAAVKPDADRQLVSNNRKAITQTFVAIKNLPNKKKVQPTTSVEIMRKANVVKQRPDAQMKETRVVVRDKSQAHTTSDELIEDDEGLNTSTADEDAEEEDEDDEGSEMYDESSVETDNDRDSDLDFDINNRKGRKRKVKQAKRAKRGMATKTPPSRRLKYSQDDSDEATTSMPTATRIKTIRHISSDTVRPVGQKSLIKSSAASSIETGATTADTHTAVAKKQSVVGIDSSTLPQTQQQPHPSIVSTIRRGPTLHMGSAASRTSKLTASPHTVKEIVLNKVMASPKGGFTDISTLLSQTDDSPSSAPATPSTGIRSQNKSSPSTKGFMPLGIEAAVKNQLPAQISIQTHQSSSELAAEHDKQLDLIDSIVKDELQKSRAAVEQPASVSENIPELVEMLESTAKALESNNLSNASRNFTATASNNEDDIDISNAPLLGTPEDDISDEFIQQVVKLMEDDKTLQEEVEKQVVSQFGDDSNEAVCGALSVATTPPPLAPIFQQTAKTFTNTVQPLPQILEQTPKSIIQMAISNIRSDTEDIAATSPNSSGNRLAGIHTPKTAPLVRKEPIQIVRGNGRVITLPPIEAPNTRAKRRAQVQPSTAQSNCPTAVLNDSSLDSSLQSNSSFTAATTSDTSITTAEKKVAEVTPKPRVTKEDTPQAGTSNRLTKKASSRRSTSNKSVASKSDNAETPEAKGDDDDPNRLWCICRQPHNNRFMICCDVCEDWFHGTCVNITKAMGLEMEQKSIDWTCPKCVKKQEERKQPKITDMLPTKKVTPEVSKPNPAPSPTEPTTIKGTNLAELELPEELVSPVRPVTKDTEVVTGQEKFAELKKFIPVKKSPLPTITRGQKKFFAPTTLSVKAGNNPSSSPNKPTSSHVKRVVVVQHVQKTKNPSLGSPAPTGMPHSSSAISNESTAQCIVCKKGARPNSIYCSDDCIRKHAQNALHAFAVKSPEPSVTSPQLKGIQDDKKKKAKGLFEDLLSMADRKPKPDRVNVFERKSGRVLTGHSAPTTANLKKWLQDNPTFEVVQPGSVQALEIERRQKQRALHSSSPTANKSFNLNISPLANQQKPSSPTVHARSTPTTPTSKPEGSVQPYMELPPSTLPKSVKQLVEVAKCSPNSSSRPTTPKQLHKYPQQVSIKPDKVHAKEDTKIKDKDREKAIKRQDSSSSSRRHGESPATSADSEPVRENVRRTLKEQLLLRVSEAPGDGNKLTPEEVEEFVTKTEAEMYNSFNRDTGAKYKAKYRSLMFNIKDRKNHTLFAKICAKQIGARQLVHMSPEELASQELAQWREKEAKHQLEMIKKSELDMLSCAKNYVLKTHKGEEVIEDKLTDRVNLDLEIPVEDVVSVLNNSANAIELMDESSTGTVVTPKKEFAYHSDSHGEKSTDPPKSSHKERDHDREREREHERERERDREKRHKSKDHHREKSRLHKRSHSRSRSRSHSKEKRHKSSHKDERRDREERATDRDRNRERPKERNHKEHSESKVVERKSSHSGAFTTSTKIAHGPSNKDPKKKPTATPKQLETFSLIDQILESSKTMEEAANLITDKEIERQPTPVPSAAGSTANMTAESNPQPELDVVELDQEPTSTIAIPPQDPYTRYFASDSPSSTVNHTLWSGSINMIDVASFQIALQSVVGNAINLGKLLPLELDVVGRIGPDTVWDYISKIKRSPNKEIVIIRLLPAGGTETSAYTILYQYLDKRKRLGVIKTTSSQIKDFYIFPLGARKHMPTILQPIERVDFYEDASRPDMLVGIIIRVIGKRVSAPPIVSALPAPPATLSTAAKLPRRISDDADSFTPPGSPKRRKTLHSSSVKDDEIDVDAIIKAPITTKIQKSTTNISATSVAADIDDADEPYSPGGSSDEDVPLLPLKTPSALLDPQKNDLKRKMEELNRQIAAQEMEIAGLLNVEPMRFTSSSTATSTVLANISIPSNLSQILASIKSKPETPATSSQSVAPPPPLIGSLLSANTADNKEYNLNEKITDSTYETTAKFAEKPTSTSRLAQLSEAELLSMVPDGMIDETPPVLEKKPRYEEPPPPGV